MRVVGVDLAGVESRPTGFCLLEGARAETSLVYGDDEVLKKVSEGRPEIVAVDAPLSLPTGRETVEQRTSVHLRECDRELLRRGIRFFPVTLGPMRKLTVRGIGLKKSLKSSYFNVIEVYPGGAQDILGIPRKQRGLEGLRMGLRRKGIVGLNGRMSHHELDAVTCALVGRLFLEGRADVYGTGDQTMVMPKVRKGRG